MSEKGYRMSGTGMEPLGTLRDVRVQIYRFDVPLNSDNGTTYIVDFATARFDHEIECANERDLIAALEEMQENRAPHSVTLAVLDGQDLSGMDFTRIRLNGVSFRNCDLTDTSFHTASLLGTDFSGAIMHNTDMTSARCGWMRREHPGRGPVFFFQPASFNGADMTNTILKYTDLSGTSFKPARMFGATLEKTSLSGADCGGTDFTGAQMRQCFAAGTNFMGARISRAQLLETQGSPLCQPQLYARQLRRKAAPRRVMG